jgi:hypothetical protein
MKIFNSKKRLVILSLAATLTLGAAAVEAGAIGPELSLRGTGKFCLTTDAARALAKQNVTLQPIAPATGSGNCVTLPGAGKLSMNLTGGDIPLTGGMRFANADHRLEVTNLHIHTGKSSTTADFARDGAAPKNVDFLHYEVSTRTISISPGAVDSKSVPLNITSQAATAFTDTFVTTPAGPGTALFVFDGHAEIVNPLSGPLKP